MMMDNGIKILQAPEFAVAEGGVANVDQDADE
jgi:hypothetical protein